MRDAGGLRHGGPIITLGECKRVTVVTLVRTETRDHAPPHPACCAPSRQESGWRCDDPYRERTAAAAVTAPATDTDR